MAVLRSRAGAALSGAAGGVGDFLAQWFRAKQAEKMQSRQNDFVSAREHQNKLDSDADRAAEQVRNGSASIDDFGPALIPFMKMRLGPNAGPSPSERLAKVTPEVGADTTDSQIEALLAKNKVPMDDKSFPQELNGNGPMLPPPQLKLMDARDQALGSVQAKNARDAAQAGSVEGAKKDAELSAVHEHAPETTDDKVNDLTETGPVVAKNAGLTAGAQEDATNDPTRQRAAARGAGLKAGAEAAATEPVNERLAKTRADTALLNQKTIDDYRKAHPAMPAALVTKHAMAQSGLTLMDSHIVPEFEEMSKRGLLGPLQGRLDEIATNKLKTSALFNNPEDAQLAAQFIDHAKLLSSLAAQTHAGNRGAGSVAIQQYFQQIFNGIGDEAILKGQLGALHNLFSIYVDKPDTPELFPIPGFDKMAGDTGPTPLSPNLSRRFGGQ